MLSKMAAPGKKILNEKEMKFVVDESNSLLKKNYNMISFSSLSSDENLKLIAELFMTISANIKIDSFDSLSVEALALELFTILKNIKYQPVIPAKEFREGFLQCNSIILHQIMFWTLDNQEEVKRRAYLAKFVVPVFVPPELTSDQDIVEAMNGFQIISDQFWKIYKENVAQQKKAAKCEELNADIAKMRAEINNLDQRYKLQYEKTPHIKDESIFAEVTKYQESQEQLKKLIEKNEEVKKRTAELTNNVSTLKSRLEELAINDVENFDPMQQASEQCRVNEILIRENLVVIERKLDEEIELLRHPDLQKNPTASSFEEVRKNINDVNADVDKLKELKEKSMLSTDHDLDVDAYRNQVDAFTNRRVALSDDVMKLRERLEMIEGDNAEKMATFQKLTGPSEILQGDMLKQFVVKLRERTVVYKRLREIMAGLQGELNIAARTTEILRQSEPCADKKILEMMAADKKVATDETVTDLKDPEDCKKWCLNSYSAYKQQQFTIEEYGQKLAQARAELAIVQEELNHANMLYTEEVGGYPADIDELSLNIEKLESDVKKSELQWREAQKSLEETQAMIDQFHNQDASDAGSSLASQMTMMTTKRDEMEKELRELNARLLDSERQQMDMETHIDTIQKIRQMLELKLERNDDAQA